MEYAELANWFGYAFDRLTGKKQDRQMNAWLAEVKTTHEARSTLGR